MLPDTQVAVIGGGPAGARAAELLARRGMEVTLLEAGDPDGAVLCSGLLNREGQVALGIADGCRPSACLPASAAVGEVPQAIRRHPYRPRLEVIDTDNRLQRRYNPGYLNLDRCLFDQWLRERAAKAGAKIHYRCRVSRLGLGGNGARLATAAGDLTAYLVIDASGWRGLSRKLLYDPRLQGSLPRRVPQVLALQGTVSADLPEESMWAVFDSAATSYYGWLVPKGGGKFLLGAGFWRGARANGAGAPGWDRLEFVIRRARNSGIRLEHLDHHPEGSPIAAIRSTGQLWWGQGPVFAIGEAAGLVSPSSGDGIHFALAHANAIAAALDSGPRAGLDEAARMLLDREIRRHLRPALAELRFNCLKARVAARPRLRGMAFALLPILLRQRVERLPYALPPTGFDGSL